MQNYKLISNFFSNKINYNKNILFFNKNILNKTNNQMYLKKSTTTTIKIRDPAS
jgi:hypothetical protein